MSREEPPAMLPEPGPDPLAVSSRQLQGINGVACEESKAALAMGRRQGIEFAPNFEEEHKPVAVALVTVFADQARQMQVRSRNPEPKFFLSLPAGTRIGRFTFRSIEFPAARTPQAKIRLLRPFQQQDFFVSVETIQQCGDVVSGTHLGRVEAGHRPVPMQYRFCAVRIKRCPCAAAMDERTGGSPI